MADPISVVGTAVGITSLGIQVCQVVFQYYSQFRGIHDDVNEVLEYTAILQKYLESIERVRKRIETKDIVLSSNLQLSLQTCAKVLARLRTLAEQCRETKIPQNTSDRMRMVRKRLIWPFKRDTLRDLLATLHRFQSELQLALQVVGLDYEADQFKELLDSTHAIHAQLFTLSATQNADTAQLATNISSLSAQFQSVNSSISNHFQEVSAAQNINQHRISLGFDNLTSQSEKLLEQFNEMQQILQQMVPIRSVSRASVEPFLPALVDNKMAAENVKSHFRKSLRQYQHDIPQHLKYDLSKDTTCSCLKNAVPERYSSTAWWITFYSECAYEHEPYCPQFSHTDFSKNVGFRLAVCNRLVRKYVNAGIQQSRVSGWCSISPFLRYCAMVPANSGMFKAVAEAAKNVLEWDIVSFTPHQEKEELLYNLTREMRECLGKSGRPTDIDELGDTVSSAIIRLVWIVVEYGGMSNLNIVIDFMNGCTGMGILFNETDGICSMEALELPMCGAQGLHDGVFETLCYLARRLDNWTIVSNIGLNTRNEKYVYDMWSRMLEIEEIRTGYAKTTPLHDSILRRSESRFRFALQTTTRDDLTSALILYKYGYPLASWSVGIEALISIGSLHDGSEVWTTLLHKALSLQNLDSIQLILPRVTILTLDDWHTFNFQTYWNFLPDIGRIEVYKNVVRSFATKVLKGRKPVSGYEFCSKNTMEHFRSTSLYHVPCLTVTTAEALWDIGHRNVNKLGDSGLRFQGYAYPESQDTPLWEAAVRQTSSGLDYGRWKIRWFIIFWLINHGADAWWMHPNVLTTPAHLIVRNLLGFFEESQHPDVFKDAEYLISSSQPDGCFCQCSFSGCFVAGCAVSRYNLKPVTWNDQVLLWVFSPLDRDERLPEIILGVLRVLTFEELSLTHTCCYQIDRELDCFDDYERPSKDEIEEIQEIEKDDIQLLNKLMQEFKDKWHIYTGTLESFYEQIWKPRMAKVRQKQKAFDEIYRETGVTLSRVKSEERLLFNESGHVLGEIDISDSEDSDDGDGDEKETEEEEDKKDDGIPHLHKVRSEKEKKPQFVRRRSI